MSIEKARRLDGNWSFLDTTPRQAQRRCGNNSRRFWGHSDTFGAFAACLGPLSAAALSSVVSRS